MFLWQRSRQQIAVHLIAGVALPQDRISAILTKKLAGNFDPAASLTIH